MIRVRSCHHAHRTYTHRAMRGHGRRGRLQDTSARGRLRGRRESRFARATVHDRRVRFADHQRRVTLLAKLISDGSSRSAHARKPKSCCENLPCSPSIRSCVDVIAQDWCGSAHQARSAPPQSVLEERYGVGAHPSSRISSTTGRSSQPTSSTLAIACLRQRMASMG